MEQRVCSVLMLQMDRRRQTDRQTQCSVGTMATASVIYNLNLPPQTLSKALLPDAHVVDKTALEHRSLGFCFPHFLMEKEATKIQPHLLDGSQEGEGPDSYS